MPPEKQECMQERFMLAKQGKRTVVPIHPSKPMIQSVSPLDSILANFYLHRVYFFDSSFEQRLEVLNHSLSIALASFPFLCGRLRVLDDGSLGIKLNDAGVRAHEASSSLIMSDWMDESRKSHSQAIPMLCPSEFLISDYSISPLVSIQYTRFRCGGMAIGVSWCHIVGDLASMACFLKSWGEVHARGDVLPEFDFSSLTSSSSSSSNLDSKLKMLEEIFRVPHANGKLHESSWPSFETRILHIGDGSNGSATPLLLSDSEAMLCANLWKSIVKARGVPACQTTKLFMWMDDPPERRKIERGQYFGNAALAFLSVDETAGDLASKSTAEIAKVIQQQQKQQQQQNCKVKNGTCSSPPCSSQNVVFCCWASRDLDVDFGTDRKPLVVDCAASSLFGESIICFVANCVAVSLRPDAMKRFSFE